METIKFDKNTAIEIHSAISDISDDMSNIITEIENSSDKSLKDFKGACRKPYDEEEKQLLKDFKDIIKSTKDMANLIKDVSDTFLDFDLTISNKMR